MGRRLAPVLHFLSSRLASFCLYFDAGRELGVVAAFGGARVYVGKRAATRNAAIRRDYRAGAIPGHQRCDGVGSDRREELTGDFEVGHAAPLHGISAPHPPSNR